MKTIIIYLFCSLCFFAIEAQVPYLKKTGNVTQMMVKGKPFLMLAGEVGNSSGSDIAYMDQVMKKLSDANLNSVLVSVSWEMIEPKEGFFDFKSVDGLINVARKNNLKLGLLWFGAWKNGLSPYAPMWVLGDTKRFKRVRDKSGQNMRILTPLCTTTMNADANAYAALMKHIALVDAEKNTVIVVQVENECGVLGGTRDFSAEAEKAYAAAVPADLTRYLVANKNTLETEIKTDWEKSGSKTSGTWTELFGTGDDTDLFFMAWNYSRYVNTVVEAGKKNYNLPMYANCWMPNPRPNPGKPGNYPSGGPIITVIDIWKAGAPSLNMVGPDLYGADFKDEVNNFHRADNPLFIPETNTIEGPATYAFAEGAICFSPFGIDNRGDVMTREYAFLKQVTPLLLKYQGSGKIYGIYKSGGDTTKGRTFKLDNDVTVTVNYQQPFRGQQAPAGAPVTEQPCYGFFIQTGDNELIVGGLNLSVSAGATDPKKETWLKDAWQGEYINGEWKPTVLHNGDEAGFLRSGSPVYNIRAYRKTPAEPVVMKFKVLVYDK